MGFMIIYGKPLKEHFNFWPRWLWIANGLLIAVSLLIIFCAWAQIQCPEIKRNSRWIWGQASV